MIRPNADAARSVWRRCADPSQPEAIEMYFTLLRSVKGPEALDQGTDSARLSGHDGRTDAPFAAAAQRFHIIESAAVTVYVPLPENAALIGSLRADKQAARSSGRWDSTVCPSIPITSRLCAPPGR